VLIDTHAHLDLPEFDQDRDDVLRRSLDDGVEAIIAVGINLPSSRSVVELAARYPNVYAAVGVHPSDAATWNPECERAIAELAQDSRVVAIGEIGLDYYRDRCPRDLQLAVFESQLGIAAEANLPVIVHDREAHDDVVDRLARWTESSKVSGNASLMGRRGVIHCFSGDWIMATKMIDKGFLISIAGPITYPKSDRLAEVVRNLPLDSVIIETDSPFLSPQSWRGRRNEPAYVTAVAEKIAQLRGLSIEDIGVSTTANAKRLFGLG
jgi:TatD DNase family protein